MITYIYIVLLSSATCYVSLLCHRALEKEKKDMDALNSAYKNVCKQLEDKEESKNSTIQSLKVQIETLKHAATIPPVLENSTIPDSSFEEKDIVAALKSSVELISVTKRLTMQMLDGVAVQKDDIPESGVNLPSDISYIIKVMRTHSTACFHFYECMYIHTYKDTTMHIFMHSFIWCIHSTYIYIHTYIRTYVYNKQASVKIM